MAYTRNQGVVVTGGTFTATNASMSARTRRLTRRRLVDPTA